METNSSEAAPDPATKTGSKAPVLPMMQHTMQPIRNIHILNLLAQRYAIFSEIFGGRRALSHEQLDAANKVTEAKIEIDGLLEAVGHKIANFTGDMQRFVAHTTPRISGPWYRNVDDLTSEWTIDNISSKSASTDLPTVFEPSELERTLNGMPHEHWLEDYEPPDINIHDFDDFASCLSDMLPRSAQRELAVADHHQYLQNCVTLINKVEYGNDHIDRRERRPLQLRLWVIFKAQVLRRDSVRLSQLHRLDLEKEHTRAHYKIEELVELSDDTNLEYWGFAAAFRILWARWDEPQPFPRGAPHPWHVRKWSLETLKSLHRKAVEEVRACANYALSEVYDLPVELADMIFEATLDAEGVPLVLPPGATHCGGPVEKSG